VSPLEQHVVIADSFNHRVSEFNALTGYFVADVATLSCNGIVCPVSVCCDGGGTTIVANSGVNPIVVVGPEGLNSAFLGASGSVPVDLRLPSAVVILNDKVMVFDDAYASGRLQV
jgi:hypothetical protein